MITLRIQEIADEKGLTLKELSQVSGVSLEAIQVYATKPVELTEEIATDLKKIATKLDVTVVELVKPVAKRQAFQLKIIEMAKQKGLTLKELSDLSGVHPALLAFYSTQSIYKNKLTESQVQKHLSQISGILECRIEDLKLVIELPTTMFRIEELLKDRNLTLYDLKMLTDVPDELIDLVATQPLDINSLSNAFLNSETQEIPSIIRPICCLVNPKSACCKNK